MILAIVSPFPPAITGIGQYGYHFSRSLAHCGLFSRIVVLAGAPVTSQLVKVPQPMRLDYAWKPDHLSTGWVIWSRLRQLKPDLVWYNMGASVFGRSPLVNLISFLSPALGKFTGIPTVVTLHELVELADLQALNAPGGQMALFGARMLTKLATCADVVCLTKQHYVDWLSSHRSDLTCVHIPIGAYYSPEILPETDLPELLFFTSLAPFKGLDVLIAAYRSLLSQYPNLRLTVAGAEHPRFPGYAENLRRKYGSIPGLQWLGQVSEEQVRALFTRAMIVVLPYTASTGSSSVLYQAAMWGRPVVASDLPEIRSEAAENCLTVEFFKSGEAASLAGAIQTLLDKPTIRNAQVEHNFNSIQRIRPEEMCRLYLQAFNLAFEIRNSPKRINIPAVIPMESV